MIGCLLPSCVGNLPCSVRNDDFASASLRCEETCTRYPPSVPVGGDGRAAARTGGAARCGGATAFGAGKVVPAGVSCSGPDSPGCDGGTVCAGRTDRVAAASGAGAEGALAVRNGAPP